MRDQTEAADAHTPIPTSGVVERVSTRTSRAQIVAGIDCPFEMLLNGKHEEVGKQSAQWAQRMIGGPIVDALVTARPELMSGGFYPTASLERLRIATDYLFWAFSLDDTADESAVGSSPARLARIFERYDHIFRGEVVSAPSPSERALRDILDRLSQMMTRDQLDRFRHQNFAYFGAMLWEAANREAEWVPDESSYLALRPAAGAVPPFYGLIPLMEQIPKQEIELTDSALANTSGRLACWVNDLLSYEKERDQGDLHNLILVYRKHRQLSEEAAISLGVDFVRREYELLSREQAEPGASQLGTGKYLATLRSFVATTFYWTNTSRRYTDG